MMTLATKEGVMECPLTALQESPHHQRSDWGDLEALAASIRKRGVIEPLIVRPLGEDVYEIVAGVRRSRASKLAGKKTAPVLVWQLDDDAAIDVQIDENLQRTDLHPIDEAELFGILRNRGLTVEKIAARGPTSAHVRQRLQLLALSPEVRAKYRAGELSHAVAFAASRIVGHELQVEFVLDVLDQVSDLPQGFEGELDELLWSIRDRYMTALNTAPFDIHDATLPPRPCEACPERSDAQRELFPELAKTQHAWCLSKVCFNQKIQATWDRAQVEAESQGVRVLDGKKGEQAAASSAYVRPDSVIVSTRTGKLKTLEQAAKALKTPITPILVKGTRGEPQYRYPKDAADQVRKAYEARFGDSLSGQGRDQDNEAAKLRRKREQRRRVRDEAARRIGDLAAKKQPKSLWLALLSVMAEAYAFTGAMHDAAKARGLDKETTQSMGLALLESVKGDDEARAVVVELFARQAGEGAEHGEDWPQAFRFMCSVFQVDLRELAREVAKRTTKPATAVKSSRSKAAKGAASEGKRTTKTKTAKKSSSGKRPEASPA